MKYIILLAALCASTLAFSAAPKWPRLPLDVLLSGKFNDLEDADGKIVGGQAARANEIPFQISLRRSGSHSCGGSVLATNKVLTAAHCTDGAVVAFLSVGAGGLNVNNLPSTSAVSRLSQHPSYSSRTTDYDVSVLFLASPFDLSGANIGAVTLASSVPAAGTAVTVSGWGTTSEGGSLASTLQKVEVNIVSTAECQVTYGASAITPRMICAGVEEGGKDSCQGDSGGPLFLSSNKNQVGIVSWGYGCARPSTPGVYSNVPALLTWINQQQ